jgi:hypothetical protein
MSSITKLLKKRALYFFVIIGSIFILISFLSFGYENNQFKVSLIGIPKIWLLIIGIILIIIGLVYTYYRELRLSLRFLKIKNNKRIIVNNSTIILKVSGIENTDILDKGCAIVLPANTTFVDECITDKKSALGSFFQKHHQFKDVKEIQNDILETLKQNNIFPTDEKKYCPATTILLAQKYNVQNAPIILTASSEKTTERGFFTEPSFIFECIKNIYHVTKDKRIDTICIPLIGCGHGGLSIENSLLYMLHGFSFYSKTFLNLRQICIYILPEHAQKMKPIIFN